MPENKILIATISGPISRSGISAFENLDLGDAAIKDLVVGNFSPLSTYELTLF